MKTANIPIINFGKGEIAFHPMTSDEGTPLIVIRKLTQKKVPGSLISLEELDEAYPVAVLDFKNRKGVDALRKALSEIRFEGEGRFLERLFYPKEEI